MITPEYLRTMAVYNAELNRRVYGAAGRLTDGVRRKDGGAFFRSIHGTLAHVLWADRVWLSRFGLGQRPDEPIRESSHYAGAFEELWSERQAFDEKIVEWAASMTPNDIEGDLEWFSGALQETIRKPRAVCLMQVFNHQTHHRGQVHALLTRAGEDPGATDLPFVL
ncbi:MAG: DinB family protein [Myxococcota bacterium]